MQSPQKKLKRVVILGAGLAGLSAAYELSRRGYEIVLLEKEAKPGGLAISLDVEGVTTDLGPHRIHTELPEIRTFLHELAGDDLYTVRRFSRMFLRKRYLRYPVSPVELLVHFGAGKLFHYGASYVATRARYAFGKGEQESYEGRMKKAFGAALYRDLIYPYTKKVWGVEPHALSGDIVKVRVSAGGLGRLLRGALLSKDSLTSLGEFVYIKGGIEKLVEKFTEPIVRAGHRIVTGVEVVRIEAKADNRYSVIHRSGGKDNSLNADVCISTIPLPELVRMLLSVRAEPSLVPVIKELRFISMILVFLVVGKERISPDSWLYFPELGCIVNRAYEAKNFDPQLGPKDRSVLCAEVTCFKDDALWKEEDATVAERAIECLAATKLFSKHEVIGWKVWRIECAYPLYDLVYQLKLQKVWRYLRQFPNLLTIGRQGLFHHNNMDHSIWMGLKAAEYVDSNGNASARWYDDIGQFKDLRIID
jgi:protoporphyrinogen oxidase